MHPVVDAHPQVSVVVGKATCGQGNTWMPAGDKVGWGGCMVSLVQASSCGKEPSAACITNLPPPECLHDLHWHYPTAERAN